jgi:hypothetical protein
VSKWNKSLDKGSVNEPYGLGWIGVGCNGQSRARGLYWNVGGTGRITTYSPNGEYLEQLWFPGGFNTSRGLHVDTGGYAYSLVLLNYGTAPWDWVFGLARTDAAAGILDTVAAPTWDYEPPQITASRENSSSSDNVPFSPDDYWSFSPLGYMIVWSQYSLPNRSVSNR